MKDINALLDWLSEINSTPGNTSHFAYPAKMDQIVRFEKKYQVKLPRSYKSFLSRYNGGMILYDYQSEFLQTQNDYELYKGEAIYLMSIEEIAQKYADLKYRSWKVKLDACYPYPIIPFCSLPNNELLVFVHGLKSGDESPVFDAYHEEFPTTWGQVAPSFTAFLEDYITALGRPATVGDEHVGVVEAYCDNLSEKEETPNEVLQRVEVQLESEPDHAFFHYEQAAAYKDRKEYSEAYLAISRAIKLEEEDPFYYFIRGEILTETGQHRAALIDFDIALKFQPNDTLYLCCRAGSFFHLNRLKDSLDDCNRAIALESSYILGYMVRKEIYEVMGMEDKAEADQMTIDRLEKEN